MPPLMQSSGGSSEISIGAVVNTAKASPRVRTVCRSRGGVRGNDRRNATKRSLAVGNGSSANSREGGELSGAGGEGNNEQQSSRAVQWDDSDRRGGPSLRVDTR